MNQISIKEIDDDDPFDEEDEDDDYVSQLDDSNKENEGEYCTTEVIKQEVVVKPIQTEDEVIIMWKTDILANFHKC